MSIDSLYESNEKIWGKLEETSQFWIKLPLCSFLLQFKSETLFSRVHEISSSSEQEHEFSSTSAFGLESVGTEWSQRETDSHTLSGNA